MSFINPSAFTTRPEIEGTFSVVTTTHWIGTAVGMGTLEQGGNAFDASDLAAADHYRKRVGRSRLAQAVSETEAELVRLGQLPPV